jgi:tellurite resistance protein TerC
LESIGTPLLWGGFTLFVLGMLALDLGVFHRKEHVIGFREALGWTAVWICLALLFNAGILYYFGSQKALEFLTGYVIEKALSVDNIFVFLVLFSYFKVPKHLQHRVLFWGILGALVMRFVFIIVGAALLATFHWVIYVFGAILVITGIKLFRQDESEIDPEKNIMYRFAKRLFPTVSGYREKHFFVVENGKRYATSLFLVLIAIEATDVVFAVDSIPAIFAVTNDPFIVYTSNILAILGLRALYFALAGILDKFHYLNIGLAVVLIFVGLKMLISGWIKIPILVSLGVIAGVLLLSVLASMIRSRILIKRGIDPAPEARKFEDLPE